MGKHIEWREPQDRAIETTSKTIEVGRGASRCQCYVARSNRVGPGVLVLHEFFGLQDSFRRYADDLAAEGFTVLVPDLYDGKIARDVEEATALAKASDDDAVMGKVRAAADHLLDNWHPRMGTVGFSFGAAYGSWLAKERDVDATVLYYGWYEHDEGTWSGPVLGHFAEVDEWESIVDVRSFFERLQSSGVDAQLEVYSGVGHWFANAAVTDAFDPDEAQLAKQRTIDFLTENLA